MTSEQIALVERALVDLRKGKPVIVADSHDREDEADFIMSAQTGTVEWVAWGIRHSSGYLCAPMPGSKADSLGLPLMVPNSQDPRRTASTVETDWINEVKGKGIDGAKLAAEARALIAKHSR